MIYVNKAWYQVKEIMKDIFWIHEPGHVSFYILKKGKSAIFIDSGLGLSDRLAFELLNKLDIKDFIVYNTHLHCDHIGLNHLANKVYVSRVEWDKYNRQGEEGQLFDYYNLLKRYKSWPDVDINFNKKWSPTSFIDDNTQLQGSDYQLSVLKAPGHTSGSMVFYEKKYSLLFIGDLVYTGDLYLHFKDSNLLDYNTSLTQILELSIDHIILPSHNTIPLDRNFITKTKDVVNKIIENEIHPIESIESNSIFEEAYLFESNGVRIYTKRNYN